jgi:hypothetical protein
MTPRSRLLRAAALAVGAYASSSCSPSGFQDESLIASVRILASSADQPYAKPGATVKVTMLAYDGRATKTTAMQQYWLPFVCENPAGDAYYACFPRIAAALAGGGGAGGVSLGPGVDLTPLLQAANAVGPQYTFTMPADAVTSHAPVQGTTPYGIAILFNFACAGHLEIVPIDPNNINPQTVPIGCFDKGSQVGPDDYVFGYTRVYAYDTLTNANPVIQAVDVNDDSQGADGGVDSGADSGPLVVAPDMMGQLEAPQGIVISPPCTGNCQAIKVGPIVPASSQEVEAQLATTSGNPIKEEIWVDYYTTMGSIDDTRLLYDSTSGLVGDPNTTDGNFSPPSTPGAVTLWAVVHDDRGGTSWVTIPVTVVQPSTP